MSKHYPNDDETLERLEREIRNISDSNTANAICIIRDQLRDLCAQVDASAPGPCREFDPSPDDEHPNNPDCIVCGYKKHMHTPAPEDAKPRVGTWQDGGRWWACHCDPVERISVNIVGCERCEDCGAVRPSPLAGIDGCPLNPAERVEVEERRRRLGIQSPEAAKPADAPTPEAAKPPASGPDIAAMRRAAEGAIAREWYTISPADMLAVLDMLADAQGQLVTIKANYHNLYHSSGTADLRERLDTAQAKLVNATRETDVWKRRYVSAIGELDEWRQNHADAAPRAVTAPTADKTAESKKWHLRGGSPGSDNHMVVDGSGLVVAMNLSHAHANHIASACPANILADNAEHVRAITHEKNRVAALERKLALVRRVIKE